MVLMNETKCLPLANKLELAEGVFSRMKGLLGRNKLEDQQGLWIRSCNSIHTWFMQFPIDVIFVDQDLKVKSTFSNLKPWRFVTPQWGAKSVFELPVGTVKPGTVDVGDQLNVVT